MQLPLSSKDGNLLFVSSCLCLCLHAGAGLKEGIPCLCHNPMQDIYAIPVFLG